MKKMTVALIVALLVLMLTTNPTDNSVAIVIVWFVLAGLIIFMTVYLAVHKFIGVAHVPTVTLITVGGLYLIAVNTLGQLSAGDVILVGLFGLVASIFTKSRIK